MNTTIRNLIAAVPLAAAAVTMTPALAMADGPVIVIAEPGPVDPEGPGEIAQPDTDPEPHPQPGPQGPEDKAGPNEDDPQNPDDKDGPKNDEPVDPDGPGGITNPDPCPTHAGGPECTPDQGDEPTEPTEPSEPSEPEIDVHTDGGVHPTTEVKPVVLPTRVDAGLAPATEDGGLNLAWTLAGGALVTASGAAFAARRVRRTA